MFPMRNYVQQFEKKWGCWPFIMTASGTACGLVFQEGGQRRAVGRSFGKYGGMLFKGLEQLFADGAALPAKRVVHPYALTADVNPAAPFEIGQMARHRGLRQLEYRHQIADAQLSFGLQ